MRTTIRLEENVMNLTELYNQIRNHTLAANKELTLVYCYYCVAELEHPTQARRFDETELEDLALKLYRLWLKDEGDTSISRLADHLVDYTAKKTVDEIMTIPARKLLMILLNI